MMEVDPSTIDGKNIDLQQIHNLDNNISSSETSNTKSNENLDQDITSTTSVCSRLSFNDSCETVHGFNLSNVTVIENVNTNNEATATTSFTLDLECKNSSSNDGSDSGVELCTGKENTPVLQREFSNNSGEYASSCGNNDEGLQILSCDSSLISCCSNHDDAFEILARKNSTLLEDLSRVGDGTSEGGSESSSVAGSNSGRLPKNSISRRAVTGSSTKKKVALTEPTRPNRSKNANSENPAIQRLIQSRSRPTSSPGTSFGTARERARSRDKSSNNSSSLQKVLTPQISKTPVLSRPNTALTSTNKNKVKPILEIPIKKDAMIHSTPKVLPSNNRNKTMSRSGSITPTDDGRWPSTGCKPTPPIGKSSRTISTSIDKPLHKQQSVQIENKTNIIEKYATLPRRKREKSPETKESRSTSVTRNRDLSLTRSMNLKRQTSKDKETVVKTMPPYPKKKIGTKTKIYHEISIQTAITLGDIENALSGIVSKIVDPEEVEKEDRGVQVDRRHEEVEKLQAQIKELIEKNSFLADENKTKSKKLLETEQILADERREKLAFKKELDSNTKRVQAILDSDPMRNGHRTGDDGSDSLLALESQFQNAGKIVLKQEQEISELHSLCRSLQRDLDKSITSQNSLMQQHEELENDSSELQEFVQAEKAMIAEVLRDTEEEVNILKQKIQHREIELQKERDKAKHLIAACELKRQESLSFQNKYEKLESQSRELLLQQGGAVSGAAVALSALSGRLEGLISKLVTAYSISDQDLEDVIYHNEAYSNSESSEGSPEKSNVSRKSNSTNGRSPSPKRGASFVSAIIGAIRNAASQNPFINSNNVKPSISDDRIASECDTSDSAELLDSETEPVLMMENVLEDVTMPDTYSHNMVSSTQSLMSASRMQMSVTEITASLSEYGAMMTLVDQVVDVDNLVTKLLKVLRIIQMENDTYIEELQEDKATMVEQVQKQREACEEAAIQLKEWEMMGSHLKTELADTSQRLNVKSEELEETRSDLSIQKSEIDRLSAEMKKLSSLCSQAEIQLHNREEEANITLKEWQESGKLPSADVLARLITARHEIPILKNKLIEKEKQLAEITEKYSTTKQVMTESWSQAVTETRKQYEAIDSALEILAGIQSVVEKCPPLAKLQHDLEEISFQCASSLPIPLVASDFNANANHRLETSSATAINSTA